MKRTLTAAVTTASLCLCVHASAAPADGEAQFRELYKELVETNTTLSAGSCTLAAERMAARLKAAGFADVGTACLHRARAPQGGRAGGDLSGARPQAEGDPAAGAPRRRRGEARGLDARSLHARRGERQLLRARRGRRQGGGGDLGRHAGPLPHRELPAAAHAEARAHLRRGDRRRLQRRRSG